MYFSSIYSTYYRLPSAETYELPTLKPLLWPLQLKDFPSVLLLILPGILLNNAVIGCKQLYPRVKFSSKNKDKTFHLHTFYHFQCSSIFCADPDVYLVPPSLCPKHLHYCFLQNKSASDKFFHHFLFLKEVLFHLLLLLLLLVFFFPKYVFRECHTLDWTWFCSS